MNSFTYNVRRILIIISKISKAPKIAFQWIALINNAPHERRRSYSRTACIIKSSVIEYILDNVIYSVIFFETSSSCSRRVLYYKSITERVKGGTKEPHFVVS